MASRPSASLSGSILKAAKPRKKPKADNVQIDFELIDDLSDSELVEVAKLIGAQHANRSLGRAKLLEVILEANFPGPEDDPLNAIRERTWRYIQNHPVLVSLMTCSLHCPTCPANKVVECYSTNQDLVDDYEAQE